MTYTCRWYNCYIYILNLLKHISEKSLCKGSGILTQASWMVVAIFRQNKSFYEEEFCIKIKEK